MEDCGEVLSSPFFLAEKNPTSSVSSHRAGSQALGQHNQRAQYRLESVCWRTTLLKGTMVVDNKLNMRKLLQQKR